MKSDKVEKFSGPGSTTSSIQLKNSVRVGERRGSRRYRRTAKNMNGEEQREELQSEGKKGRKFVDKCGVVVMHWEIGASWTRLKSGGKQVGIQKEL